MPIRRGRICVIPQLGVIPTRAWVSANLAASEAIRKSAISAISSPPVTANPLTAAITGCGQARMTSSRFSASFQVSFPVTSDDPDSSFRSTPAQNARPAPVRIIALTPVSPETARIVSVICEIRSRFRAFSFSGRFSVSSATGPWRSTTRQDMSADHPLHRR